MLVIIHSWRSGAAPAVASSTPSARVGVDKDLDVAVVVVEELLETELDHIVEGDVVGDHRVGVNLA